MILDRVHRAGASSPAGPVLAGPILREKVGVFISAAACRRGCKSDRNATVVLLSSNNVLFCKRILGEL